MPQWHLAARCERVNIVWGWSSTRPKMKACTIRHPPACSKRESNISKSTDRRVNAVWVTFSQLFHSVCEHIPTFQPNVQHMPKVCDVTIPFPTRVQRCAFSVHLACFLPCVTLQEHYTSIPTMLHRVVNKMKNNKFYCNTYFSKHVL